MNIVFKACVITAMVSMALLGPVAEAKPGDSDGPGHGPHNHGPKHHKHGHPPLPPSPERVIVIRERNYPVIREYYEQRFHKHCPPGWAKHGACAPPGQVTYVVGQRLPYDVVYEEIPTTVIVERPPAGYRYVRVDNNVLLIDAARHIVDAAALINAAN